MRKEVKRIRVLVIRKLVRSVGRLKSKKGSEDALVKNQKRAQRLLEEIHAMKELKPDVVTKSALGDDINFEKTCKKPDSTATERAIARLAEHPVLRKKMDELKAAVQAFKDARQNAPEVELPKCTSEEKHCKDTWRSNDASTLQQHARTVDSEQKGKKDKLLAKKPISDSKSKIAKMEVGFQAADIPDSSTKPSGRGTTVPAELRKTPAGSEVKTLSEPTVSGADGESEEEPSEEEQEDFDDSTEERFYKQSSASEESDSGDDFFIGKVRRTRKKERNPPQKVTPREHAREAHCDIKNDKNKPTTDAKKFESVFFQSLSGSKGFRRDQREQAPKRKTPDVLESEALLKPPVKKSAQGGPGGGRQQSHLPLHPSWEASRRRKEQQSKITVFQGTKITFDD
uniref:Serum response factor-binding protein 1 n=3 Tax=Jaculus jaculus TaxID=51337 RepID=A0A8C5NYN4_JACJA|nr:serum response factor-binding protein 1 isoform X2 [Jaculus jaculus]